MDCNRCNTNYNRSDYSVRRNMQNRSMVNMSGMSMRTMDDCDKMKKEDDCNKMKEHVDHMNPGMSYVPWQKWEEIYDMEKGFEKGTIFCQLDKPYVGRVMK